MVDFLALACSDLLLFILKLYYSFFTKQPILKSSTILSLPLFSSSLTLLTNKLLCVCVCVCVGVCMFFSNFLIIVQYYFSCKTGDHNETWLIGPGLLDLTEMDY